MNITCDHETWFREIGQFLEPAGNISSPEMLDLLKRYSQSVRDDLESENETKCKESFEQGKEEGEASIKEDRDDLKIDIRNLINNADDGKEAETIQEILNLVRI